MINDFQLTKDFNLREFECTHPKHHHVMIDSELVEKLQQLRDRLGSPIIINSGYRCSERNKQVGGAKNSYHMKGMAVDISLNNQELLPDTIVALALKVGFRGIIVYDTFLHLDIRLEEYYFDKRSDKK